jgi:hypothetical protein
MWDGDEPQKYSTQARHNGAWLLAPPKLERGEQAAPITLIGILPA